MKQFFKKLDSSDLLFLKDIFLLLICSDEVAYLPIDPADIGRSYQEVIRINSQSGKGGVAYVLNRDYGLDLPRWLQVDFSAAVQAMAERSETEVQSKDIYDLFLETYHLSGARLSVGNYQLARDERVDRLTVQISGLEGSPTLSGKGAGVVGAFTDAISSHTGHKIIVVEYSEHTLGSLMRSPCAGHRDGPLFHVNKFTWTWAI